MTKQHITLQRKRSISAAMLITPATLLVAAALLIPSLILLRFSFNRFDPVELMVEAFTLENYVRFFTEPYFQTVMATTFGISITCTIASVVLGFPVAYFLARTQSRFKSLFIILTVFPLLVGNVVRAAGWMAIFGTKGFFNTVMMNLGLINAPIEIMYTHMAVFIGTLSVVLPFMILTLQTVLETIDYSVSDAAQNLGASPTTTFRRVILPLSLPGIAAGSVLVFILCMNAYATPFLLGGPSFKMMAPAIYHEIAGSSNWPFGSALAFILMAFTIIATACSTTFFNRRMRHLTIK